MAFEKAKEKYKKLKNEYDKRKSGYEAQRKSWAESKAVKLETQAKKDQELLNVYKRQDKAMKQSEELKAFRNKTKPKGFMSGSGDFMEGFGGSSSMFGSETTSKKGKKGKKKNNDKLLFTKFLMKV